MKHSQNSSSALIIFAKAPAAGQVKTRLCPPLTPDEAASLHGSIVLDTLECSRNARKLDRFLACSPSKQHPFFKAVGARHGVQLWDQVGHDLGMRMDQAFRSAFELEYQSTLLVGTDLPTLQSATLEQALRSLADYDIVLGPTLDGGYYLIGLKKPVPELFLDIPWSTDHVLSLTQQKAGALGLSITLLPQQRDLDTIDDLNAFIKEMRGPGKKNISHRTAGVLQALSKQLTNRE